MACFARWYHIFRLHALVYAVDVAEDQAASIVSGGKASSRAELTKERLAPWPSIEGPPFLFLILSGMPATCNLAHLFTLIKVPTTEAESPPTCATDIPLSFVRTSTDVLTLVIAVLSDWPYIVSRKEVSATLRRRIMLPTCRRSKVCNSCT